LLKVGKPLVFLLCLVPFFLLVRGVILTTRGEFALGANPVETITHITGDWILRFLLITLAITPLRSLTGWTWLTRFRRMTGLFAFFYAILHFAIYWISKFSLSWAEMWKDISTHLYVTVGFTSFVLMIPLAITSTKKWIARLGGKRWQRLHRLVYLSAIGGVLHYLWLVKLDATYPLRYAAVLAVLLLFRVWTAVRPRLQPKGG
jgi:methionine sulfoxide reductase heme-binding subunit